jgi:bifunctional non-homologous end joining protein LigD
VRRQRGSAENAPAAFVAPSLATLAASPPQGTDWVHEIKYDGYRVQMHVRDGSAVLLTRNGLDWTTKFGKVGAEVRYLDLRAAIIDGEAIVQNDLGVSDFDALQREFKKGAAARIAIVAFDLLMLDGEDWRPRPLLERKSKLKQVLGKRPPGSLLYFGDHMTGAGREMYDRACKLGLEGIVSKRTDRPYRSGRSGDWRKIKCVLTDDLVVIGYVGLKGASEAIGSLVLGYVENRSLHYAGRVGTGFTAAQAHAIWQTLQTIRCPAPPLARALAAVARAGVVWVEPTLVAEVQHRGWTPDNVLRQSAFKTFREDKTASQIGRPESLGSSSLV